MSSETPVFTVGPPPHWRNQSSVAQTNYAFILALGPAALIGAVSYGMESYALSLAPGGGIFSEVIRILIREFGMDPWYLSMTGALGVLALGVGTGLLVEYLVQVAFRQPYRAGDGHGALMGLIMAMLMPPTVPWWVLVIGIAAAIVVGKQIYGGIGNYPMHPAMVGWLILLLSWQNHIYPVGHDSIAAMNSTVIYATFLGGLALLALGHVRWEIPFGVIVGVVLSTLLFQWVAPDRELAGPIEQLVTGHVILAAFFILTDSTSSPANRVPVIIFALFAGVMIMLIRTYGVWPDAVPFAVLLANVINPLLDKIRPKPRKVVMQNV